MNGQIIILNGAPRSGKSSIAAELLRQGTGVWLNLGVDSQMAMLDDRYQPGIGLRPGGERPDLEPVVESLYLALYRCVAAHSAMGLNMAVDVGHHDDYSRPLKLLPRCMALLAGLPVMVVGVDCPLPQIMRRRAETWGVGYAADGSVPAPVARWQAAVHQPGIYDIRVDTSRMPAEACARLLLGRVASGSLVAAARLAALAP